MKQQSFEELCHAFAPLIKREMKRLGSQQRICYDELYQIGLIALWEASVKFDEKRGYFPSFAQSYVRGRMLTFLKKEANLRQSWCFAELNCLPAALPDQKRKLPVATILPLLSQNEQQWLKEFLHTGSGPTAIAEKHQVSSNTVKTWRKRALQKIRLQLKKTEFFN